MSKLNVQNMDDFKTLLGSCVLLVDAIRPLPAPFHDMLLKFGAYRVWNPVGRGQHGLSSACKSNFGPLVGTRHADEMLLELAQLDVVEYDGFDLLGLFYGPEVIGILGRDTNMYDSEPTLVVQTWFKNSGRRHFRAYWSEDRLDLAPSLCLDWNTPTKSTHLLHFEGVVNRLQLLLDPEGKMDGLPSFA
jgi:hypothetical protein